MPISALVGRSELQAAYRVTHVAAPVQHLGSQSSFEMATAHEWGAGRS